MDSALLLCLFPPGFWGQLGRKLPFWVRPHLPNTLLQEWGRGFLPASSAEKFLSGKFLGVNLEGVGCAGLLASPHLSVLPLSQLFPFAFKREKRECPILSNPVRESFSRVRAQLRDPGWGYPGRPGVTRAYAASQRKDQGKDEARLTAGGESWSNPRTIKVSVRFHSLQSRKSEHVDPEACLLGAQASRQIITQPSLCQHLW